MRRGKRPPGVLYALAKSRRAEKQIVLPLSAEAVEVDIGVFQLVDSGVRMIFHAGVEYVFFAGIGNGKRKTHVELPSGVGNKTVVGYHGAVAVGSDSTLLVCGMHGHFNIVSVIRHDAPEISSGSSCKRCALGAPFDARGVLRQSEFEKVFHL